MDTIIVKIVVKKSDEMAELLRDKGLFFDAISNTLQINKKQIDEISIDEYAILGYDQN